jgi:tetratricopeptide (TPR) repeat protein
MRKQFLIILTGLSITYGVASAQSSFERLGQKAMMGGEFNTAANYFEKAYANDNSNMNVLWLMGYSNFHAAEYKKSVEAFDKLIEMKPTETAAYYYRGKAKVLLSQSIKDYKSLEREKLLLGAIKDFSTAIDLTPSDLKLYQNRGLACQEYGIFKSQRIPDVYNKATAISSINSSIADFQKVLDANEGRRDIASQIDKSKQLLADIKSN